MPGTRPNFIVIFTDQQRWDTTGLHGNPLELTPNFDRLALEGTFLPNSFTCQPVCAPARACLQTGLYATEAGVHMNRTIPLNAELPTLATLFGEADYHTGYIGKWHLGKGMAVTPETRGGYQYWLGANALEASSDAYDTVVYDNDGKEVKLPGYRVDALTDAAINYVNDHHDDEFFLFLSYLEPHHQNSRDDYVPPIGTRSRYTGRWSPPDLAELGGSSRRHLDGYFATVKRIDECLGRIYDSLVSLGLDGDTVILFTSDHGCHFRTRNEEYKRSCHESSIHVPTFLWGGPFAGRGTRGEMVNIVDYAPTLLDAAGIVPPERMSGRALLPRLNDPAVAWPDDAFVQISETQCGRALRTKHWKYSVEAEPFEGYDWERHTLDDRVSAAKYVETFLYDLENDRYELVNLVGCEGYREVADELKERLLRWISEIEGETPEIVDAETRSCFQRRPAKPRYRSN